MKRIHLSDKFFFKYKVWGHLNQTTSIKEPEMKQIFVLDKQTSIFGRPQKNPQKGKQKKMWTMIQNQDIHEYTPITQIKHCEDLNRGTIEDLQQKDMTNNIVNTKIEADNTMKTLKNRKSAGQMFQHKWNVKIQSMKSNLYSNSSDHQ